MIFNWQRRQIPSNWQYIILVLGFLCIPGTENSVLGYKGPEFDSCQVGCLSSQILYV